MGSLNQIDWNLVPALDALLHDRSVTRAARRLGLSQPAASGALARLRRHFDDELLVRRGNRYTLTPLAERLAPLAREAMVATRVMLTSTDTFDPAVSTREFVIASTEYGQAVLGPHLGRRVSRSAPRVRLVFRWPGSADEGEASWLTDIDGWIAPRDLFTDMPSTGLLSDRWICVVARDNTRVSDHIPLDLVKDLSWVLPTAPHHRHLPWVQRLLAHGLDEVNISVTTENFAALPFHVAGTQRVGIMQAALAHALMETSNLVRIVECPLVLPPIGFTLWWHPNREHDAGHHWLRTEVAACLAAAGAT